ncbi:hypothetical protein NDU88_010717, partial [Pleurodeles waltl]
DKALLDASQEHVNNLASYFQQKALDIYLTFPCVMNQEQKVPNQKLMDPTILSDFPPISEDDVKRHLSTIKSGSLLDPAPRQVLSLGALVMVPIITNLINLSMASGVVPE